jgi:hypothetical protein
MPKQSLDETIRIFNQQRVHNSERYAIDITYRNAYSRGLSEGKAAVAKEAAETARCKELEAAHQRTLQARERDQKDIADYRAEVARLRALVPPDKRYPGPLSSSLSAIAPVPPRPAPQPLNCGLTVEQFAEFIQTERTKLTSFPPNVKKVAFPELPADIREKWYAVAKAVGQKLGVVFAESKRQKAREAALKAAQAYYAFSANSVMDNTISKAVEAALDAAGLLK